ncbi:Uncharacterised protein [Bordetella pertussis]|nr:Uncharacterised protein [Bordetella pertussis]
MSYGRSFIAIELIVCESHDRNSVWPSGSDLAT